MSIYNVQSGDTLSSIAKMFGTTVEKLAKDNNINNVNLIFTGQELEIEGSKPVVSSDGTQAAAFSSKTAENQKEEMSIDEYRERKGISSPAQKVYDDYVERYLSSLDNPESIFYNPQQKVTEESVFRGVLENIKRDLEIFLMVRIPNGAGDSASPLMLLDGGKHPPSIADVYEESMQNAKRAKIALTVIMHKLPEDEQKVLKDLIAQVDEKIKAGSPGSNPGGLFDPVTRDYWDKHLN